MRAATTTAVKIVAINVAGVLALVAIVLFTSNQASENKAVCRALKAELEQGLNDKLLREGDLKAAKSIARGLVRDVRNSDCGK